MCSGILSEIQKSIRQKDEEMSWVDACCLQIAIKSSKGSRGAESCTFQTRDPNIKKEWIVGKSYLCTYNRLNNFVSIFFSLSNFETNTKQIWKDLGKVDIL